mmetsp:Transcript_44084/g.111108  ORF Transcript_44084/g.111108 Transcript_44084/m.111108 type:complete len:340 (-) Transcript_44084:118-1137(-)|eukprot:CAMPEP_0174244198 /NCGR_PEP_ID=MMETSP0417-20130205/34421_1 /TAXON_ID=242541 /ORGANISM="Mayorella sp, Strain BSH-02190019" /LENGTH=339 /DNA_ID=CAMNT_0015323841 /DNA_START=114 /DNA_END=1133 /DNA_ORIENTATION=-
MENIAAEHESALLVTPAPPTTDFTAALAAHSELSASAELQQHQSFTSYMMQRQRLSRGTSMQKAQRVRSLMYSGRTTHDSFLDLLVDSTVSMDISDDDEEEQEAPVLRGRIDTSSGRLLTSSVCEQAWEAQQAQDEATQQALEDRQALLAEERPIADVLHRLGYTPSFIGVPAKAVLLNFVRANGVTGYSRWKRHQFKERALVLIHDPPTGGLRSAAETHGPVPGRAEAVSTLMPPQPAHLPAEASSVSLTMSTPNLDRAEPFLEHLVTPVPLSLVQSLPAILQVQSPIAAPSPTATQPTFSRSALLYRVTADATRDALTAPALGSVRRSSRLQDSGAN